MRSAKALMIGVLLVSFVATATPALAAGATYTVGATGDATSTVADCAAATNTDCTLRDAILASNANRGALKNTIRFRSGLTTPIVLLPANGALALAQDVDILGPGASTLAVDGGCTVDGGGHCVSGGVLVFAVNSGTTATIDGLDIQHGNTAFGGHGGGISNHGTLTVTGSTVSGNTSSFSGGIFNDGSLTVTTSIISANTAGGPAGGILNLGGTLTVSGSTLSGNIGNGNGGAIHNSGGTMIMTNTTLSANTAPNGAGIFSDGTLTVTNSTLSGNIAFAGGGIYNQGTLTVTNSTLSGNSASGNSTASNGGGILNYSTMTVTNSTLSGNSAEGSGGGIANAADTMTVTNTTLSGNSASYGNGGGIENQVNGTMTVTNSTLSGNSALGVGGGYSGFGGGISNHGTLTAINSTLSGNSALGGGGVNNENALSIANSIVAGNTSSRYFPDIHANGPINDRGYNLIGDSTGSNHAFSSANHDQVGLDPQLLALAPNGGPTMTMALKPTSPAVDAGSDAICAAAPVGGQDQRGNVRPSGAHCDIGAFESGAAPADATPPVILPKVTGTQGTNGWYTGDVTVTWSVTDPESPVSSETGCDPTTVSSDTSPSGTTLTCAATSAGGTATQSVTIRRDAGSPTTTATITGTIGANGWYKAGSTVQLTLSASDNAGGSGVAATTYAVNGGAAQPYTAPVPFADGTYTVAYSSSDNAGNVEAAKTIAFKVDTTPPATTATVAPAPNAAGWNKAAVAVTLGATDTGGSGVATTYYALDGAACSPTALTGCATSTAGSPVPVTTDGTHTLTYFSADVAGNVEAAKSVTVKIDSVAPTITGTRTPAANANGWNNTDVTASFTCADNAGGSGIASCTAPVAVSTEGASQQVVGTATDAAGNSATATVASISIDKTKPTVTYTGNAGTYTADQTVSITCGAADNTGGSGIASSTCQNITGPAYSFVIGANSYSANATDKAGNASASATASFTVTASGGSVSAVVNQFVANPGQANSLTTKLAKGNIDAFINEVNAQTGKALTQQQAQVLINLANALR